MKIKFNQDIYYMKVLVLKFQNDHRVIPEWIGTYIGQFFCSRKIKIKKLKGTEPQTSWFACLYPITGPPFL